MVIRPVMKDDIIQLTPLMLSYIVDFYQRPHPGQAKVQNHIMHLINHPDQGVQFVSEHQGNLLGFATLYFTLSTLQVKRTAILNDLFIDAEARGQNIGESLFKHCLNYVRQNAFAGMQWETAKDNVVAQSLYNKMGGQLSDRLVYEIE